MYLISNGWVNFSAISFPQILVNNPLPFSRYTQNTYKHHHHRKKSILYMALFTLRSVSERDGNICKLSVYVDRCDLTSLIFFFKDYKTVNSSIAFTWSSLISDTRRIRDDIQTWQVGTGD